MCVDINWAACQDPAACVGRPAFQPQPLHPNHFPWPILPHVPQMVTAQPQPHASPRHHMPEHAPCPCRDRLTELRRAILEAQEEALEPGRVFPAAFATFRNRTSQARHRDVVQDVSRSPAPWRGIVHAPQVHLLLA